MSETFPEPIRRLSQADVPRGLVLEGTIEIEADGIKQTYSKGDRYFIPEGVKHSAVVSAGYADVTYFDEPDRLQTKQGP